MRESREPYRNVRYAAEIVRHIDGTRTASVLYYSHKEKPQYIEDNRSIQYGIT